MVKLDYPQTLKAEEVIWIFRAREEHPSAPNRRMRKRPPPLLRESAYPDAAPAPEKERVNDAFAALLNSAAAGSAGGDSLRAALARDPLAAVLLLDAPTFCTTRAVARAGGLDLRACSQVALASTTPENLRTVAFSHASISSLLRMIHCATRTWQPAGFR